MKPKLKGEKMQLSEPSQEAAPKNKTMPQTSDQNSEASIGAS